jgi:hypothetical protein
MALRDSGVEIDDSGRVLGARSVEFFGEYLNPTTGQTMIVNLANGQKQWVPIGTTTNIVLTGSTGPANYMLRVYHWQGSAFINWPTGLTGRSNWPSGTHDNGSQFSGTTELFSVYAVGITGPQANQYYLQSGGAAFG